MPKVTVDLDKCVGAGVCKSVCPVDVYDLVEMPDYNNETKADPARMEDCIMCMACV
jgi:NAD-dependent dihydropyrimidine dehydrogenase PreA subunit